MRTYQKALKRIETDAYKKGAYKGDAPTGSRHATHRRYINIGPYIAARMYYTDVFKLYPDGRIIFDSNGYFGRPTTRDFIHESGPKMFFYTQYKSKWVFVVKTTEGLARAYDGMELLETGVDLTLLSKPEPFRYSQVDRVRTKALRTKTNHIYELAEFMLLAGDPGPFPCNHRHFMCLEDEAEGVVHIPAVVERFARGLIFAVNESTSLAALRKAFLKSTTIHETVTGPNFLNV